MSEGDGLDWGLCPRDVQTWKHPPRRAPLLQLWEMKAQLSVDKHSISHWGSIHVYEVEDSLQNRNHENRPKSTTAGNISNHWSRYRLKRWLYTTPSPKRWDHSAEWAALLWKFLIFNSTKQSWRKSEVSVLARTSRTYPVSVVTTFWATTNHSRLWSLRPQDSNAGIVLIVRKAAGFTRGCSHTS